MKYHLEINTMTEKELRSELAQYELLAKDESLTAHDAIRMREIKAALSNIAEAKRA